MIWEQERQRRPPAEVHALTYKINYSISCPQGHGLVNDHLSWRSITERLMRSLAAIIMCRLQAPTTDARPTAHPRIMEAIDPHFECLKPLFNQVSVSVITPTAETYSSKGSLIAEAIDEKHGLSERSCFSESPCRNAAAGSVPCLPKRSTPRSNLVSRSIAAYNQDHSLLILTAVSSTATRFGFASGGSGTLSDTRCTH